MKYIVLDLSTLNFEARKVEAALNEKADVGGYRVLLAVGNLVIMARKDKEG